MLTSKQVNGRARNYINLPNRYIKVTKSGTLVDRNKCLHHWKIYGDSPVAKGESGFVFQVSNEEGNIHNYILKVQMYHKYPHLWTVDWTMDYSSTDPAVFNYEQAGNATSYREVQKTNEASAAGIGAPLIDYWTCDSASGEKIFFMVLGKIPNAVAFAKVSHPISLMDSLGCVIHHMHGLGLYHYDLHEENILLDITNGHVNRVWIIDFGMDAIHPHPLHDYVRIGHPESNETEWLRTLGRRSKFGEDRLQLYHTRSVKFIAEPLADYWMTR